ncbi:MAG TPA: glycosyltransferase family protein [Bacteroidia bacterium]|jgi:spore coat polysaccharide biosynthesis protein SpsF|nr:glycosyltransferase family protein [Bacteroidia bacterium]
MNLLIIQARMGSTRLPGKVLMDINGKSILENLIERVSPAKTIDKLVIATTTNSEDDAIENFCKERNLNYYRGSDWDVLGRFYNAALPFNPTNVIRVTSDCPLHSHKVIDFIVNEYLKSGFDYFSNSNNEPEFLEDGFDTEVFSFKSLESACKEAKMLSEREHVTPYIKKHFNCGWKQYNSAYHYKLSVDSRDDFKTIAKIFEELKSVKDFGMEEVVTLLTRKPEIAELNKNSIANSGYLKSIKNDKPVK